MTPDLEFDSDVRRRIYEYVEQHGAADYGEVRDAVRVEADPAGAKPTRSGASATVPLSPREYSDHVEALVETGHLHEDDDELQVAVEATPETVELDDGAVATVRLARESDSVGVRSVMSEVAAERTSIVAESVAEALDDEPVQRRTRRRSRVFFVATVDEAGEDDPTGERGDEDDDRTADRGDEDRPTGGEGEREQRSSDDRPDEGTSEDADVVGWVHLDAPEFEKLRHTAELTVGVRPDHRQRGIGSRLLERGLEWADEQGYRKAYQSVPATNDAAVEFLEGHGWTVEATREDHYLVDDEFVDEVMLATWVDGE